MIIHRFRLENSIQWIIFNCISALILSVIIGRFLRKNLTKRICFNCVLALLVCDHRLSDSLILIPLTNVIHLEKTSEDSFETGI